MTSCEAGNLPQKISSVSSDAQKKKHKFPNETTVEFLQSF